MDPVSLLLAFLLVEAVSSGAFTSAVVGAAGGALRAAWLGGGSTGSGGGSKTKGSTKTKSSTGRSGGHIRRGAVDGFRRGRAEAAERRRQRRERVRGWWRDRQAKRRERPSVETDGERPTPETRPDLYGPRCGCCGMFHGRALAAGEHCDWCRGHAAAESPQPVASIPTQTPPAGPADGEPPKEGTRMADVSATQSVTFWEDIADQVSRQVEAEQSAELAVNGAADVKDKISGHAQQVADEFSGLIEAAKGSSHEYASTYRS